MNAKNATLTIHGQLRDFLHSNDDPLRISFKGRQSVKHIIESFGIPHPEVEKIYVNKEPKDFPYILDDGDQVDVFPWQIGSDLLLEYHLEPRFILDNHLGKLAVYLRVLGIDSLYKNDFQDDEIAMSIRNDERVLLTRDRRLLMRREIRCGYCVRHDQPKDQLIEVINRFNLQKRIRPFNRCLKCNHELGPVDKASILDRLEPLTKLYYEEFHICPNCDQIYWKGSHYDHMLAFIHLLEHRS